MKYLNHYRESLSCIFHGLFGFLWMALLPGIVMSCLYFDWKGLLFFGGILLLIAFAACYRPFSERCRSLYGHLSEWIEEHSALFIFLVLMGIQIVIQVLVGYELMVEPSSDRKVIFNQAQEFALSGNWNTTGKYNFYFLRYPNNVFLLLLEAAYFTVLKWLGIRNFLYGNMFLNLICIDVAIALCFLLVNRKFRKKTAVCFQFLCLFFIPFYTYIPFVYTDTLTLPCVAGILLLFELLEEFWAQGRRRKMYLVLAAIGFLTFAGFELKPTVAVLTIAGGIYLLIARGGKAALLRICCILFVFLFCVSSYRQALKRLDIVDQTDYDTENFPYTHWIMMGLQGFGNYSLADRQYTSSFETKEEKQRANIAVIKSRLHNYGVIGLLGHQYVKGCSTWFNGKYDMDFHLQRRPVHNSWLQGIFFRNGSNYFLYSAYCTLFQFFLLAMVGISLVQGFRNRQLDTAVMWKLALFGLFLFLAFWEAKSRYVMHFTPVLLLIAVDTVVKNKARASGFVKRYRTYIQSQTKAYLLRTQKKL